MNSSTALVILLLVALGASLLVSLNAFAALHAANEEEKQEGRRFRGLNADDELNPTPEPTPETTPPSLCFSAMSTVQVEGRGVISMKDLKVGDKVLTGSGAYQSVYSFGHYNKHGMAKFLQIHHTNNNNHDKESVLEMTGDHLVFIQNGEAVPADSLQVGDALSAGGRVTKITDTYREGLYMPLTQDGTIVVGGIVASNYVSIAKHSPTVVEISSQFLVNNEQTLFHWWLAPFRMMCMGVSSSFCYNDGDNVPSGHEENEGILNWLLMGRLVAEWLDVQHLYVQYMLGVGLFLFFGTLLVLEWIFGPALAPMFVLTVGTAAFVYHRKNKALIFGDHHKGVASFKKDA